MNKLKIILIIGGGLYFMTKTHYYKVTVKIGNQSFAGTDTNVCITICGDEGKLIKQQLQIVHDSIEYERLETLPQDNEDKENLFKDLDSDWFTEVEPVVKPDRKIALQAHNGQYVCVENGEGRLLVANRSQINDLETFKLIDLGDGKIALQAHNGQYISAENGGGRLLAANSRSIDHWETFKLIDLGDGKIALKAHNGHYVCAENGGGSCLVANRSNIDHWETFKLSIAVLSWVQYSSTCG
ncbi:fascin domain-containing protein [Nostoc parmelioides]|uniref:Fascin-like domain-containing protein n=1 Tax=Nostoc parmelioides FACHB-3921 TaxID=2692909 RepID=A0ABR8BP24_9NOSO|nr:hypothetical protein [Nostoc parmelioides]MBD2255681.1 hypothetical protein [Nostoc parmelioides FACHB-3921]